MNPPGFSFFNHTSDGIKHKVFHLDKKGPPVIIIHELPGMSPECLEFGNRLHQKGFSVYLPLLFGKPGKKATMLRSLGYFGKICISREIYLFKKRKTSPVVTWLRSLCRKLHEEHQGKGVGAIGMCLTGGFAIPMMVEPSLMAPVLSQPSLPIGIGKAVKQDLACSPGDLKIAKERAANGTVIKAYRFDKDKISPAQKVETYQKEFGDALKYHCLNSDQQGKKGCHSVFTLDYYDEEGHPTRDAFDNLVDFFSKKLL